MTLRVSCDPSENAFSINFVCDTTPQAPINFINGPPCEATYEISCPFNENGDHTVRAVFTSSTGGGTPFICYNSAGTQYLIPVTVYAPPSISSVLPTSTSSSITVSWTTDAAADSKIDYAVTNPESLTGYPFAGPTSSANVTSHSLTIPDLEPSSLYYYRVTSCNQGGCDEATGQFSTISQAAGSSPTPTATVPAGTVVHNLITSSIRVPSNTVTIGSTTVLTVDVTNVGTQAETFEGRFDHLDPVGTTRMLRSAPYTVANNSKTTVSYSWDTTNQPQGEHQITFNAILLTDHTGNSQTTALQLVPSTGEILAISNVKTSAVTTQSAVIEWDTNIAATSLVRYGKLNANELTESAAGSQTHHKITLNRLERKTKYVYNVESCSTPSNCKSLATVQSFTTTDDAQEACQASNKCLQNTFVQFEEKNGACVESKRTICKTTGCLQASCDIRVGGCIGIPSDAACKDECGGESLKFSPQCIASDTNKLYGECIYQEIPCNEYNFCNDQNQSCGAKPYYCVKSAGKYVWENSNAKCLATADKPGDIPQTGFSFIQDEVNPGQSIEAKLGSSANELLKGAKPDQFNLINATFIGSKPSPIRENDTVELQVTTNSKSKITSLVCAAPVESRSECNCRPITVGAKQELNCVVSPPAKGRYLITVLNSERQSGSFAIVLENAKTASVFKVEITDNTNKDYFIVAMAIGALMVLGASVTLFAKFREKKVATRNYRRELELIPTQREQIKMRFMKGLINPLDYQAANAALDKRAIEAQARLDEQEKKHPQMEVAKEESGDEQRIAELKLKKVAELKSQGEENKSGDVSRQIKGIVKSPDYNVNSKTLPDSPKAKGLEEENTDLTNLIDALNKKKEIKN